MLFYYTRLAPYIDFDDYDICPYNAHYDNDEEFELYGKELITKEFKDYRFRKSYTHSPVSVRHYRDPMLEYEFNLDKEDFDLFSEKIKMYF